MTNMHCHWVRFKLSCLHICHWPPHKELQKSLGLGIFVIDCSQWQICMATECDLNSVACIFVIDRPIRNCKKAWVSAYVSLTKVNDKYALNTECDLNSVASIFVIDHSQWQICIGTECDLNSVACIFVIDRPIRNCKKAWVSAYVSLTKVNDRYALPLSVI